MKKGLSLWGIFAVLMFSMSVMVSCAESEEGEGDKTEQNDKGGDAENGDAENGDNHDHEGQCQEGGCQEGQCQGGKPSEEDTTAGAENHSDDHSHDAEGEA